MSINPVELRRPDVGPADPARELRSSEERYRRTLNLLPMAVYTCDTSGVITFFNHHAALLWGREPRLGDTDQRFCGAFRLWRLDGSLLPHDQTPMALALKEGHECRNMDVVIERPDGSRVVVMVNIDPIRDDSGAVVGAINAFHDVTVLKEAERLKRENEERLREADRKKDEFLAMLAHELRNPLAPIRTGLELIKVAGNTPEAVERVRSMMERQVGHMVRLIDDLLDVSRITSGKIQLQRKAVLVEDLINTAVEANRAAAVSAGLELAVRMADERSQVFVDPTRFVQVLSNILNNATKFTPAGGRITLTTEVVRGQSADGPQLVLRIADTGVGIPPAEMPEVFELFTQGSGVPHQPQPGLGIGLALARQLIELHGGTIEARSDGPNLGSEFIVRLPAAVPDAPATSQPAAPAAGRASLRRVLIVDDNRDAADTLAMLIRELGGQAQTACSGAQGLEVCRDFDPDVVLLDIGMPGMDGYELCRRLRSEPRHRKVLIVALTGWGQDHDRQRAMAAGFDAHLTKPAEPAALTALLADH